MEAISITDDTRGTMHGANHGVGPGPWIWGDLEQGLFVVSLCILARVSIAQLPRYHMTWHAATTRATGRGRRRRCAMRTTKPSRS